MVIAGNVWIGDDNWIGAGTVLGAPPEIRSLEHDFEQVDGNAGAGVVIGNGNVLRETVVVHSGWKVPTRVADSCFIMNRTYLAHDVGLCDSVTLASGVALGGHVRIGRGGNIGLNAAVHQRTTIGALAMIGMGSVVTRDVPPYVISYGVPARIEGMNIVGMTRSGINEALQSEVAAGIRSIRAFSSSSEVVRTDVEWYLKEIERT